MEKFLNEMSELFYYVVVDIGIMTLIALAVGFSRRLYLRYRKG